MLSTTSRPSREEDASTPANPPDGSNEHHRSAGTQGRTIIERKLQNLLSRSLGEPEKEEKEKEKEEEEVDCVVWTRI